MTLIVTVGTTFANPFYANISADGELGSCFPCMGTIVKEVPCIAKFLKTRDWKDLLKCGVSKADVSYPPQADLTIRT